MFVFLTILRWNCVVARCRWSAEASRLEVEALAATKLRRPDAEPLAAAAANARRNATNARAHVPNPPAPKPVPTPGKGKETAGAPAFW